MMYQYDTNISQNPKFRSVYKIATNDFKIWLLQNVIGENTLQ